MAHLPRGPATVSLEQGWFDWTYKGVDHSFPGNGGLECRDFLGLPQRYWESGAASVVALLALILSYPRLRLPPKSRHCDPACLRQSASVAQAATVYEPVGKRILLLLMCLTFGIELGFKFATRRMIWIGNPCHLATMMQIFILSAPPSRIVTAAFRLHMHMLTGAPIAILFPVINTRLLPFETGVYFLQHVLMLVIPFYCLWLGDPFIPEKLGDFSWAMTSFGLLFLYHFIPLQFLAYISQVNLNNMLCPAVSDPFRGKFYRLFAIGHQFVLIPTLGKLFVLIARSFGILACDSPCDCEHAVCVITQEDGCGDCPPVCPPKTSCAGSVCPVPARSCFDVTTSCRSSACSIRPRRRLNCRPRCCEDFYRQRRYSCPDEDFTCLRPCYSRTYSSCRPYCSVTVSGNRCWSNPTGPEGNSEPGGDNPQPAGSSAKRDDHVEEEEDSGFLGGTPSCETISAAPDLTPSPNVHSAPVAGGESSSTSVSNKQEILLDGDYYYCYANSDHVSDSSSCSSTESQHNDKRGKGNFHCCKQQNKFVEDEHAGVKDTDTPVQHIVKGQMVERRQSGPAQEDKSVRSSGQGVRHRTSQGASQQSNSNNSQHRKSREIVVEGGPSRRVFELKNCGNSSKVTSSVEKALSGGREQEDKEDGVVSNFIKLRSKVH